MPEVNQNSKRGRKADKRNALRSRLAKDLQDGVFVGKLPGLTVLAKRYDACAATLQRTLRQLAEEDLVEIRPRSGTYVKHLEDVHFIDFVDEMDATVISGSPSQAFLAEYGPLYNGLYETLQAAGATLHFHCAGRVGSSFLAGKKRVIAIFSQYMQDFVYRSLAQTHWIRVMGAQDYNCPGGHITYDNFRIGKMALAHLAVAGCRRFACLGSPRMLLFRQRIDSFQDEAAGRGMATELWNVDYRDMSLAEISRCIQGHVTANREALRSGELGIFSCADHFMVLLRQELAAAGLSPGEVRHLSCDNNQYYLQGIYPQSTEIDIGMYRIGVTAARQILGPPEHVPDKSAILPELILPKKG